MDKNILIIGLNSEIAQDTIEELKKKNWNIDNAAFTQNKTSIILNQAETSF